MSGQCTVFSVRLLVSGQCTVVSVRLSVSGQCTVVVSVRSGVRSVYGCQCKVVSVRLSVSGQVSGQCYTLLRYSSDQCYDSVHLVRFTRELRSAPPIDD